MKKLVLLITITACMGVLAQDHQQSQSDIHAIRAVRLASNDAIAAQDAEAVAQSWTEDIQVTISSGTHLDGKAAYQGAFESVFQSIPGITFIRSPQNIKIGENGEIASERGQWTGYYPGQAVTSRSGVYMAYWRLVDGQWLISAELYVPLEESP